MHASEKINERGVGGVFFAAMLMLVGGVMAGLTGIAAIAKSTFYVVPADYWITLSTTAWGWTLLAVGVVLVLAAFAAMYDDTWARWLGIGVVSVAAVVTFLFLPVMPYAALALIALDIWALNSLTVHVKEPQMIYLNDKATITSREMQSH